MRRINVLGVPVHAVNIPKVLRIVDSWIAAESPNFVCFRDVHGVMACQEDEGLKRIHDDAGLVCPDGMPLVWLGRVMGYGEISRVCGPDLMLALCAHSLERNYRHFLYGGKSGVPQRLAKRLQLQFPGLKIVGHYSPPFRPLTEAEDREVVRQINESKADIVWVGLSTPKQEQWMADHIGRLSAPVLLGVGAAFDYHSGKLVRAPWWMQRSGLEWLYRLMSEPRRLWRRYLIMAPRFLIRVIAQIVVRR